MFFDILGILGLSLEGSRLVFAKGSRRHNCSLMDLNFERLITDDRAKPQYRIPREASSYQVFDLR
jgi:hypothetical protein